MLSSFLKHARILVPGALVALPLMFAAPASAADYTATARRDCSVVSGIYQLMCNSTTVSLPSDKTWVAATTSSGGTANFNESRQTIAMGGGPLAGETITYNFILKDENGDTYTFAVTITYYES